MGPLPSPATPPLCKFVNVMYIYAQSRCSYKYVYVPILNTVSMSIPVPGPAQYGALVSWSHEWGKANGRAADLRVLCRDGGTGRDLLGPAQWQICSKLYPVLLVRSPDSLQFICILTNCICSLARSFPRVLGGTGGSSTAAFVRAHKRDAFSISWRQTWTFPAWFPWSSTTERTHYAARILSCVSLML